MACRQRDPIVAEVAQHPGVLGANDDVAQILGPWFDGEPDVRILGDVERPSRRKHPVAVHTLHGLDGELVAWDEFVDAIERRAIRCPVAGDARIAGVTGQSGCLIVTRSVAEVADLHTLDDDLFDVDRWHDDAGDGFTAFAIQRLGECLVLHRDRVEIGDRCCRGGRPRRRRWMKMKSMSTNSNRVPRNLSAPTSASNRSKSDCRSFWAAASWIPVPHS